MEKALEIAVKGATSKATITTWNNISQIKSCATGSGILLPRGAPF